VKLKNNFLNDWKGTKVRLKYSEWSVVFLSVALMALVLALVSKEQIVTIVPPNLTEEANITANTASESYKKAWGVFAASTIGNVTPENVEFVRNSVKEMLSPDLYRQILSDLETQAQTIKEEKIAVSFQPKDVTYSRQLDIVFISGNTITQGPYGDPEREPRTYEFTIKIKNYVPTITWFDSYLGMPKIKPELRGEK